MNINDLVEKIAYHTDQPPGLTEQLKAEARLQLRAIAEAEGLACMELCERFSDENGWDSATANAIKAAIQARAARVDVPSPGS
jgi:hypothetical protein